MTPKGFTALAAVAAMSAVAATVVYSSSVQWSSATQTGTALFPGLRGELPKIAEIEIEQGGKTLVVARKGDGWLLEQHDSFPASAEKIDALLASLAKAELIEPKTQKKERFAILAVEDPAEADAKSHLVRLLDKDGKVIAAAIVGKRRIDELGMNAGGTYVRKPDDDQAWLANATIDAGVELTDWVNAQLFEVRKDDVKHMTVNIPNEEPLEIERSKDGPGHALTSMPEGKKLKYVNIVDEVVRAATTFDFSDVRKRRPAADDAKVGTVVMELEGGLKATLHIREEGDETWLSVETEGEGETKKVSDALMARAKGWEFRIPKARADEILKRREDLLEAASS